MAITKRLCCIIVDTQGRKVMVRKKVSSGKKRERGCAQGCNFKAFNHFVYLCSTERVDQSCWAGSDEHYAILPCHSPGSVHMQERSAQSSWVENDAHSSDLRLDLSCPHYMCHSPSARRSAPTRAAAQNTTRTSASV